MYETVYEFASHLPLVTKGHILAYCTDRVNARIHSVEAAGADWLRCARELTVLNTEE
jgi:hypothetical protein